MKTGKLGKQLIKDFESLHDGDLTQIGLQPKMCPAGIWTEGWGHAIRDLKGNFVKGSMNKQLAYSLSKIKNEEQANVMLDSDLHVYEVIVERKLKVSVNQNQFDALVSHTYNTGGSNTLFDLINNNSDADSIYKWFTTRYIQANGKTLPGLVRRRKAEADLYFKPC